jgi:methyl-accepting chemotaxis protein
MYLAQMAEQLARGDIDFVVREVKSRDEIGTLATTFRTMKDTIGQVLKETDGLIRAVQAGQLETRGKTAAFAGEWRKLVVGINTVIDAFVEPINVTATYIDRVSKGDIPEQITEAYHGEFNTIKQNLNTLFEAMHEITRFAERVAAGDLSVTFQERAAQYSLTQALNTMTQRLNAMVSEVKTAADTVALGSQGMSRAAEEMSQGATEQAASAEQVSASMEEMAANIRQNADNAQQTEQMALQAATDARESGEAVGAAVQTMQEIAKKITIIEEIARQTHMLSLNATIEAAKAEEHGKGFAVVASEVRALAERSRLAAEEINELASSGVAVAERAGQTLTTLVPTIHQTAELVQEISAASSEQKLGAEQINQTMQQLDQIIQQNALHSEEMASTAEELVRQAEQLQHAMAFFRVDETAKSSMSTSEKMEGALLGRVLDRDAPEDSGDGLDTESETY